MSGPHFGFVRDAARFFVFPPLGRWAFQGKGRMSEATAVLDPPEQEAKTDDAEEPKTLDHEETDLNAEEPSGEDEEEADAEDEVIKGRIEAARIQAREEALAEKEAEEAEAKRKKDAEDKKRSFSTHSATYQKNLDADITQTLREVLDDPTYVPTEAVLKRHRDRYQAHNRDTQQVADFHADNRWLDDARSLLPKDKHTELEALTDKEGTTTRDVLSFLAENVAPNTKAVKALVNGLDLDTVKKSYPQFYKAIDDYAEGLYKNGLAGKSRDGKRAIPRGEPTGTGTPTGTRNRAWVSGLSPEEYGNLSPEERRKAWATP